ncbi:portal protein, partial [Enterococcus faecium]|nr:portal protein [Enterococcus faecium]
MISTVLSLERYKKLRVKYATQIEDGMFDPNGFIEYMKPFFADRERKYLAYTSEKNEIDNRPKPNTDIV